MDVRIVLVRPRNPLNMGAAARAMANFGLRDLVAVKPYAEAWREARSAVGAESVLKAARESDLAGAIAGCSVVLGTTSARRRAILQPVMDLPGLQGWLEARNGAPNARVAILFGSEKTGLSNRDLEHCHALVRVPTDPRVPSMNLSHAVSVVAYELSRTKARPPEGPRFALPTREQIEDLVDRTMRVLEEINYMQHMPASVRREKARRAFLRWNMIRSDAAFLQGIFKRVRP